MWLLVVLLIDSPSYNFVYPILPFLAETIGAEPAEWTRVHAASALANVLAGFAWGWVVDRIGPKPVLAITLALKALAVAWLSFVESVPELYAARVASGALGGTLIAAQVWVADGAGEERARALGRLNAAFAMGIVFGPLLSALLVRSSGGFAAFDLAIGTVAVASGGAALVALGRRAPHGARASGPTTGALLAVVRSRPARDLLLASLFAAGALHVFMAGMTFWSRQVFSWEAREVGLVLGFAGGVMGAVQALAIGAVIRRIGSGGALRVGAAAVVAGGAGVSWLGASWPGVLAAVALFATGIALVFPTIASLLSECAGEGRAGQLLGANQSMMALARVLGPSGAGLAYAGEGKHAVLWLAAALGMVTLVAARAPRRGSMRSPRTVAALHESSPPASSRGPIASRPPDAPARPARSRDPTRSGARWQRAPARSPPRSTRAGSA